MIHDDLPPLVSKAEQHEWVEWLAKVKRDVYPAFKKAGVSFGECLIIMRLTRLENTIDQAYGFTADGDEETE